MPPFTPSQPASFGGASSSSANAMPSDPSEISATAQALLQTHYGRLHPSSTSLDSQRSTLAKLEAAARNIDRICLQLDNLHVTQQLHSGQPSAAQAARTLQPLGPLAFWPATLVLDQANVFVRQDPQGLDVKDLLVLEDVALPMLTASPGGDGGETVRSSVKLPDPSRTVEVGYVRMAYKQAQMQLQTRKAKFVAEANRLRGVLQVNGPVGETVSNEVEKAKDVHMVNEDNEVLNEEGLPFYEPVEQISEEEANRNKKAYMQPFVRNDDDVAADKQKRKQWLDDMLSKLEAEERDEDDESDDATEGNAGAPVSRAANAASQDDAAVPTAEEETRVVLRTRTPSPPPSPEDSSKTKALPEIVSAARPPPPKSALKASALRPSIVQRPSFGSAGIRHGFLNLNPSSPGAIKSSYSWEDLEKEEAPPQSSSADGERSSRSHTPTPLSRNASTAGSSLLSRVTDAVASSPMTSGTSTPTKKSVRIKSPERAHPEAAAGSGLTPLQRALRSSIKVKENYTEPTAAAAAAAQPSEAMVRALESGSGTAEKRHKDDVGVEEEAERIVRLLGPDVVEGHPSAPPADVLKKMQEAHEEDQRLSTPEAVAARAKHEEAEREKERLQRLAEKPALGQAVMERPRGAAAGGEKGKLATQVKAQAQQAKFSAFKAGFLNQKPTAKFVPNKPATRKPNADSVPAAPTQSLGMSALDRAALGDDELSERRQAMGLPAAVPHARPSKAYAEKMKQRQQGVTPTPGSGVHNAEEGEGEGEVKLARPVAEDDLPRPGRVRFGPPAGSSSSMPAEGEDGEGVTEINSSAPLDNHLSEEIDDGRELDEEQEEPKIEGEGADTDEEDAYFDRYLSNKRSRRAAAADSRGVLDDADGDDLDEDDEEDWDVDDDDDFDDDEEDDFDYDPEDLMALAPNMGGGEGLSGNPELLREYEAARAKLAAMGLGMPGSSGAGGSGGGDALRESMMAAARASEWDGEEGEEEDDDYEMDVVPLDAAVEDPEYQGNTVSSATGSSRISRFKASLAQQKMTAPTSTKNSARATDLEAMLSSAQNLGSSTSTTASTSAAFSMDGMTPSDAGEGETGAPVMIIPQLAPVRFPKNGDLIEGRTSGPVELDGVESDEDDDKAEMIMRSRLERLQWKREHPEEAKRLAEAKRARELVEQGQAAPSIGSRRETKQQSSQTENHQVVQDAAAEGQPEVKPKKVSRFKAARMGA